MKLFRCDICRSELTADNKTMIYSIDISDSEDVYADTEEELALHLNLEHVCLPCAELINKSIKQISKERRKK